MMRQDYAPPTISDDLGRPTPHAAADRNYFSRGARLAALSEIDQIPISDLVGEFGSPLFVFSEKVLRGKARRISEAFKSRYPDTSFAWSYKTNNLNAIFQILREEGWIAEVVSDFEYQKARKLGIPGKDIVFNGPYKPRGILEQANDEGALIQIDNWDELGLLEDIVKDAKEPIDVGVRVWLDAGISPLWSKFGFALANGEAERAAIRVTNNPNFRLHTLHTHLGTYILKPDAYRVAAQKLVALRDRLHIEHGHLVDCLNLGGGFPSYSLLHGMPGPAEQTVPSIEAYADAITEVLNNLPENQRPHLRLESGRYLVDEAGYLLTNVVAVKGVNRLGNADADLSARAHKEQLLLSEDARVGYILDAGINLLYTAAWFQIDATPSRQIDSPPMPARLFGPLCMAIDVVRDHIDLPPLEIGDLLTLHPVGAYNLAQSMQFITYRPAVVLISANGTPELIRVRETLDDVDHAERLPARLSPK